jgi:DNA-binding Lrp family transcriptional regulator
MLVNAWQRDFPLTPRPFAEIAVKSGRSEEDVLQEFRQSQSRGIIDRVGPVFRPNTVGASLLAALAVPPERLEEVAATVSRHPGVNHNYEREHRHNLWFVVTGASPSDVEQALSAIEEATALAALRLPLLEEYHIDLGFDLRTGFAPRESRNVERRPLTSLEKDLVARVARGLPLVPRPYAAIGLDEETVIATLERWLAAGIVRRIGAVVRHRPLGIDANAMVVWDVPDEEVAAAGRRLAAEPAVTLCYRRARALPDWPYNLYCMVHGRVRSRVLYEVKRLSETLRLARYPRAVLFSRRCFAQRAARYG